MNPHHGIIMVFGNMEVEPLYIVHSKGEAWKIMATILK